MRTKALVAVLVSTSSWGQTQKDTPEKPDRATAYYHYAVARMYADMAANSGTRNRDYVNKAIENYKAAIKADPQSPVLNEELARVSSFGRLRVDRPVSGNK